MTEIRRCIGSVKFGIEPHEAPLEDFPHQASQKDGLGRMCKVHWSQYTGALRKAALARKAEAVAATIEAAPTEPDPAAIRAPKGRRAKAAKPEPIRTRTPRRRTVKTVAEVAQEPAAG